MKRKLAFMSALAGGLLVAGNGWAQEAAEEAGEVITAEYVQFMVNNIWILIAAALVFVMHLGFAMIESGLERSKNTVNILFKNGCIVAIGLLTYAAFGFNLMYPGDEWIAGNVFGFAGFGLSPGEDGQTMAYADGAYTYFTDFIFQGMFAATAATIVSGAVAGRIKLGSFLIFSTLFVGIVYPIIGSWKWGGGWLDQMGFYDFAGSTLVHGVGGFAALAGAIVLGPRLGKYIEGNIRPIVGHSMPLAALGMFLLWFGWFGFNGGSVLSADPDAVSFVFTTTALAAASGLLVAAGVSALVSKKPDLSMALNGALAGLVGITAGADVVSLLGAIIAGGVAGAIVVFAVIGFDKVKIDDPVGAISVHGVCGIWGTVAVGIFGGSEYSVGVQLLGALVAGATAFVLAFILFTILKVTLGIRVEEEVEYKGLDLVEHGQEAYGGFQVFSTE